MPLWNTSIISFSFCHFSPPALSTHTHTFNSKLHWWIINACDLLDILTQMRLKCLFSLKLHRLRLQHKPHCYSFGWSCWYFLWLKHGPLHIRESWEKSAMIRERERDIIAYVCTSIIVSECECVFKFGSFGLFAFSYHRKFTAETSIAVAAAATAFGHYRQQ